MRIGTLVALLAATAAAQSGAAREMRWAFWTGRDISVSKAFDEGSVRAVARSPELTLGVCRYAVDTSYKLGVVHHFPKKALGVAGLVKVLADAAREHADNVETRWATIEARIYREKLLERMAAKKKKRTGPKRVRLNDKVKTAYLCEVLSRGPAKVRPWYYRLRLWVFSGKARSYGIRLDDRMNDGVAGLHPEVAAMLESVRVE